jgi:17beta-estradiol 17-dehydrogenase/3beta-hydroxysteroid 3-dehydrogenase
MKTAVITGGNGAVGMGIAKRLLQEYEIKVLLVCRNLKKAKQAQNVLITSCFPNDNEKGFEMVQVVQGDLEDVDSVFTCCQELLKLSRLDYLVLNAGVMPTDGIDLWTGIKNVLTRPSYVAKTGGDVIKQRKGEVTRQGLGKVFASNVFGHFIMVSLINKVRQLQALIKKSNGGVFWCSSTTAVPELFDPTDYQCLRGDHPYESSKRLCELVSMALHVESDINSFITSPGNVSSGITQDSVSPWLLLIALYILRFLGCSGINITGENAATSVVDLMECSLDQMDPNVLYHSEINVFGKKSTRVIHIEHSEQDLEIGKKLVAEMDQLIAKFRQ